MILEQRQSLPLDQKIVLSKRRIIQWYEYWDGDVYISYSGGKDSTVLMDMVKNVCHLEDVPAVYCDTGLEYPEVREIALQKADIVLKPELTFKQVIEKYGYPVISKEQAMYIRQYRHSKSKKIRELRWNGEQPDGRYAISDRWKFLVDAPFEISEQCCGVMKKRPFHKFSKETGRMPYIGTMAEESRLRWQEYKQHGCNAFDLKHPKSTPLGFWREQDILHYIKTRNLEYASCYGEIVTADLFGETLKMTGCHRTGCMFCMFGVHMEQEPNRFQRMKETHPKQYDYCINRLGLDKVLDFIGVPYK